MSERKTDVLNLRLDPSLAREIERIAEWRGKTASEVARELLTFGVTVERQLEANELQQPYTNRRLRESENVEVRIEARLHVMSYRELADRHAEDAQERAAIEELHPGADL
jgi:hypothetical protein